MSRTAIAGTGSLLVALGFALLLEANGAPPEMARVAGLLVFTVGFWAFSVLPEAITALTFLLGAVVLTGMPSSTVFSGYTTAAFWLVFSGAILGSCTARTGLTPWLAGRYLGPAVRGQRYTRQVAAVLGFAVALALVLPSVFGRVVILVPLVLALAESLGHPAKSRASNGLVLVACIGTFIVPISFLPANLPNIVIAGSLETLYGITPGFTSYLLLHFPVLGVIKGIALVAIVSRLHAPRPGEVLPPAAEQPAEGTLPDANLPDAGRRMRIVLLITLALWMTDSLHGLPAAWIALGAALVCLLPVMKITSLQELPLQSIFPVVLFAGAVLSIGPVMTASGAGAALSGLMVDRLPLETASDFTALAMLAGLAVAMGLATTIPVAPAVTAPLFGDIAERVGWSIEAVGMSQVIGYATPLLPYQLPPILVAAAMAGIPLREAARILLLTALVTTPLVLPAAWAWWQLLGWF